MNAFRLEQIKNTKTKTLICNVTRLHTGFCLRGASNWAYRRHTVLQLSPDARDSSDHPLLDEAALAFLTALHNTFDGTRKTLLARRDERQRAFNEGDTPSFLPDTQSIRNGNWQVADAPADLSDRRVEITGPAEAKMIINALNSPARVFMADLEDALSPTWDNVLGAQESLFGAVRKTLGFESNGKRYALNEQTVTLVVRPRGLHLNEKHMLVDGEPISASLFDFGLYFFHNASELLERGSGPYLYLPKLESHHEARLWNEVFVFAQDYLGIPAGSVRATVLIETLPAAFEMEEILYELREHAAGLNAGRWDYIFSFIKTFQAHPDKLLPERAAVGMTVPFMHAYTELLIKTCHKRGAHALGGMAAFIPNRRDPAVTEQALAKVSEDKRREAQAGCDGTWVAHPDLIGIAQAEFDAVLGGRPHQKDNGREDVQPDAEALLNPTVVGGRISEAGVRNNISVALQYLSAWLSGTGAAAIHNLMEDAATAEISRAQLWQWRTHRATLASGETFSEALYLRLKDDELGKLQGEQLETAARLLDDLVLSRHFEPFLTLKAYAHLP
jgi:malate synthase